MNVVPITSPAPTNPGGGNGAGGSDERLRLVEQKLAVIENEIHHLATKADIERMVSSQLKWFIGILVLVVVSFVSLVFRLTLQFP